MGVLVLIGALAIAGYFGWERYGQDDRTEQATDIRAVPRIAVVTALAETREIEILLEAVGSTRARRSVAITPAAAGRVTEFHLVPGAPVKSGDMLLKLDDGIERADVAEAAARVRDAEGKLARAQALRRSNTVAEATVEQLTAELAIAKAQLERAERRLRDRTVFAPFDGIVGFTDIEIGARVEVGDHVTVLDDLSAIEVEFSLPERWFGRIQPGKTVRARAAAFTEREFTGRVETLDSRIDPISRAFKVRAVIGNEDSALPVGMFMHLSVMVERRDALTIPEEAVVFDGSRAHAFVAVEAEDGGPRAAQRHLDLGQRAFGFVEVLDGVSKGERVIVRGVQKARDGAALTLEPKGTANTPPAPSDPSSGALGS
nr:efflux RND transporter periplasmic adaptor subunit [Marivibrio halodurans]